MRAFIVTAAGGLAAGSAASGTRPMPVVTTQGQTSIGRDVYPVTPVFHTIDPDEVTLLGDDGVRHFLDGALVGLWRSLRAHRVTGPLEESDTDMVEIQPSWDGTFVEPGDSAAAWAEREASKGRYVIAPIFLAYDTPAKRYLWSSPDASPAQSNGAFAVVLAPGSVGVIRALANDVESGG